MASIKDIIDIRLKLSGGRAVASGISGARKETEGLGKATHNTSRISERAQGATSRLTGAYKKLGSHAKFALGAVGAGAIFGIENAISSTEELSKTTTGLSRNFGIQNNVASRWGALAQAREISTSALTMSFGSLSTKMTEAARKGGTLLTPFHQMGISQEEVAKGAGNFEWGLMRVAKALGDEEGGAKRSTAAKALLGRGYKELLPLFSEGTEGLKEQLHWSDEFGVTLSGKTNEGLQDMIQAQRKNKVAMLGLKVSMTTALMPAIEAGDEQLQDFISTLNDPHMTAEQKMEKIGRQFQGLETDIIKVIEKALPQVAEQAGRLGVAMAGALGNAFLHANLLGKIAIGGYIFNLLGGKALVLAAAKTVGGLMGTSLGLGLGLGAVGAFVAYEIWEHMSKRSKLGIEKWVTGAAEWFVNGLISGINKGIHLINDVFAKSNVFSFLGVDAPEIGEIGSVNWGSAFAEKEAEVHFEEGKIEGPGGKIITPKTPAELEHDRHRRHRGGKRPQPQSLPRRDTGLFGHGDRPLHIHLEVGHKEIGSAVLVGAQNRAALK